MSFLQKTSLRKVISSVLTAIAVLLTAAFIVSGLFLRIRITSLNNEIVGLDKQRDGLREERKRLIVEYESVFSPERIDEYAREVLKMRRQSCSEPETIEVEVRDKAVITDFIR